MTAGSSASRIPLVLCLFFSAAVFFSSAPDLSAQPLSITTTSPLPAGVRGVSYSVTLAATGGTKPYTWNVQSGSLPAGLSLNASSGVISGTPTGTGNANFGIRVTSSGSSENANKNFTLTIAAPLSVTTTSLATGTVTLAYLVQLNATGGTTPYSWSIASGQLPAGLSLTGSSIGGTPLSEGTSAFTVRVTDSSQPAQTADGSLSITINPGPVTITTTSLPPATVGTAYNQPVTGNGGTTPYHWSIVGGSLPAGLNLVGSAITGTPTTAGSSTFTLRLTDSSTPPKVVQRDLTLIVVAPLVITTSSPLPSGTPSVAYSQTLAATGGTPPYRWTIDSGTLPSGLNLGTTGTLAGTPTQAGAFSFAVRVTDSNTPPVSVVKNFTLTVGQVLAIVTDSLPIGIASQGYSQALTASGGTTPYTWSLASGQLPPGLALTGAGLISGTPTTAGVFNPTIRVTDSSVPTSTVTRTLELRISDLLTVTTTALPAGSVGVAYSQQLTASISTGVTWSVISGTLPAGLTLSAAGIISGTPTTAGNSTFNVRATGGTPVQTADKNLSITVSGALAITTTTLPAGAAFTNYSVTLAASGGTPPYTWSIASGLLPAGLTLSASGTISGRPTETGNFTVTVRVNDSGAGTTSRVLTMTVAPGTLRITQTTLPTGFQGFAYLQRMDASGGPAPYTWSIASGSLPAGIILTSDGIIQGTSSTTASASLTLRVTDGTGAIATGNFTLAIGPPLTALTLSGVTGSVAPATQMPLTLSLASAYPYPVTGTLNMAFSSSAVVAADDPVTQFSAGGRSVAFTIAANSTTAVFSSPPMLLTGTVAGTITLTAAIPNGPPAIALASGVLPAIAPRVTSADASRSTNRITVVIAGYSTERRVIDISFSFEVRTSSGIQRVNVSKTVDPDFTAWYQSPPSVQFGSTFVFQQLFGIDGDSSSIEAVTATLRNGQGSTASPRIVIPAN